MTAAAAASNIGAGLANVLSNLSPNQLGLLGQHLTQSNEMRALQILSAMATSPAIAPSLMGSLTTIPGVPSQVLTWVSIAIAQPATFQENIAQAEAALQSAAVSPGILGNLGL